MCSCTRLSPVKHPKKKEKENGQGVTQVRKGRGVSVSLMDVWELRWDVGKIGRCYAINECDKRGRSTEGGAWGCERTLVFEVVEQEKCKLVDV